MSLTRARIVTLKSDLLNYLLKRLDNVQFCIKIEPVENDFENFLRIF